jgi:hypothetical protein
MRPRSLSLSEPCSLLTQSRRQSCHGSDTTRWRSPLLQPFNLLDRQIAVLRRDPCISPSSDGQLLHHEINGSAQRPKMSCVAVPVRRSLRNLICRYPVYVGRKIKFHHRVLSVAWIRRRRSAPSSISSRMFNSSGNGCREQSRHSFRARPRNSACLGRCCITFPPPIFFRPFWRPYFSLVATHWPRLARLLLRANPPDPGRA